MKPRKSSIETARVVEEIVFQASLLALHAALSQPEDFGSGVPAVYGIPSSGARPSGLNALAHSLAAPSPERAPQ
jgi:hypothetical protein